MYVTPDVFDSTFVTRRLIRRTPHDTLVLDSGPAAPRPRVNRFPCFAVALPPLFAGEATFAVGAEAIAVAQPVEYRVDLWHGVRRDLSVRRAVEPVRTSTADVERLYPRGFGAAGDARCAVPARDVAASVGVSPTRPAIARVAVDPTGQLWVERSTLPDELPRVDVFAPHGSYLGTLEGRALPLGFLGSDRVLFPVTRDDDVTVLGVFRMAPARR